MGEVSITFTSLIAESLGLPPTAFNNFFDEDQQHKLKIVKYPVRNISSRQYGHV
jgi:isopenicillin N synthase-like dioxygenase